MNVGMDARLREYKTTWLQAKGELIHVLKEARRRKSRLLFGVSLLSGSREQLYQVLAQRTMYRELVIERLHQTLQHARTPEQLRAIGTCSCGVGLLSLLLPRSSFVEEAAIERGIMEGLILIKAARAVCTPGLVESFVVRNLDGMASLRGRYSRLKKSLRRISFTWSQRVLRQLRRDIQPKLKEVLRSAYHGAPRRNSRNSNHSQPT